MRFVFSAAERAYIFDSDLCLSEVGLHLANISANDDGDYVVICSEDDGAEFLEVVADELAYRGFRPEEGQLRDLAARLGVSNAI